MRLSIVTPYLWNSLPGDVKNAGSLDISKRKLKTFLFNVHFVLKLVIVLSMFMEIVLPFSSVKTLL